MVSAVRFEPTSRFGERLGVGALWHQHHPIGSDLGKLTEMLADLVAVGGRVDDVLDLVVVSGHQAAEDVRSMTIALVTPTPARVAVD